MIFIILQIFYMQIREKVLDRIEDCIGILTKNIDLIVWIIGIYTSIFIVSSAIFQILLSNLIIDENFFKHPINYGIFWIYIFYLLIITILYIWIYLWIIKKLVNISKWIDSDIKEDLIFGIKNIINSFYTYYYVFLYVYLIPSIIIIIELILILYNLRKENNINQIMWIVIGITVLISLFFIIYRWLKTTFAIYWAIDKNDFSNDNFIFTTKITDKKWWRIFWNLMLINLILSLIWWTMSWFLWAFSFFGPQFDETKIKEMFTSNTMDFILLKEYIQSVFSFNIATAIQGLFEKIFSGLTFLVNVSFIFILYKRLEIEYNEEKIMDKPENNEYL